MYESKLDCTGCAHRPTLAEAEAGDAYCAKLSAMPQHGNCLSHSQYDAAIKSGQDSRRLGVKGPSHLAHTVSNDGTRSGTYLHIAKVDNSAPAPVQL